MGLLLFFLDGVGVGPAGPANPMARSALPIFGVHQGRLDESGFTGLPPGWLGRVIDATLGVADLPQSATGQTALFTGINAPRRLGRHQPALPGPELRELLLAHSFLKSARNTGFSCTFANAYRPAFFRGAAGGIPRRVSASTLATWAAGLRFRSLEDLLRGRAVYHDFTRLTLRRKGFEIPTATAEEAGRHLAELVRSHDLTLYEYFLTDFAGHGLDPELAHTLLVDLEAFTMTLTAALRAERDGVVITSDHGNLEDLSVATHTRYPVPLLLWGRARPLVERSMVDITDVAPALLDLLRKGRGDEAGRVAG